ncbi:MAG: hypothetical protein ACOCX4_03485 [Planctomycetota bacterium]
MRKLAFAGMLALLLLVGARTAFAGEGEALALRFALGRDAYQTNETIPLVLLRTTEGGLEAGDLHLTIAGAGGSALSFTFPLPASDGPRAEHLNIDARLLRPGPYTVTVEADGADAEAAFEVCSHVRKSSYRIVNWGSRAQGAQHRTQGEHSLGYNLVMQNQGRNGVDTAEQIRGGVDWTSCCAMSGGHQMDLRMECDWSDPYVVAQGGTRRIMRDVFGNRTAGNAIGTHFYDEPGLTWWKDPETEITTPHMVPAQVRAYRAAFGHDPLRYNKVDPDNPDDVRRWMEWGRWKLGFMSAAWKDTAWAVDLVRPDYLSFTQSQYGFSAFTDGYYFNVVASLPLVSGHGGYHDWGPGYWHPSYTLDMARARDRAKPCWYMPLWYPNTTSDETRLEQYLSFATGIQGMMTPPPIDPAQQPFKLASFDGIVESNKLMAKLGTVFTTMEETDAPVALLFSMSHMLHHQATRDMHFYYSHGEAHGQSCMYAYLAGKLTGRTFQPITDEDVVDGTLGMRHKAVLLTSIDYLAPEVLDGLAAFQAAGGAVFVTEDSEIGIADAVPVPVTPGPAADARTRIETLQEQIQALRGKMNPLNKRLGEIAKDLRAKDLADAKKAGLEAEQEKITAERTTLQDEQRVVDAELKGLAGMRGNLKDAARFAAAIDPLLDRAGIGRDIVTEAAGLTAQIHTAGDVSYAFVINAVHDEDAPGGHGAQVGMKAIETAFAIPANGAAVYDAVAGVPADDLRRDGDQLRGTLRFGPGQMRVYAQTARPIGSVQVMQPMVHRDTTVRAAPLSVSVAGTVLCDGGRVLGGSIPLRITVTDPLGETRYELLRATRQGAIRLALPLAANDPAGDYTVAIEELLSGQRGTATFAYQPSARFASIAGATRRAFVFGRDPENIFRFFRMHQDVTIVVGDNEAHQAAAERIAGFLQPWAVRATVVDAASVNRGKTISGEAAPTLCGLHYTPRGSIKPGEPNDPKQVGYAVEGPVLLIGTPEDNPLVKHLAENRFLPCAVKAGAFPGPGRGLIAYQRGAIGARQDSIALVAYDEAGLAEAAGHLYEVMAGIEPLTPWTLPATHSIAAADTSRAVPALAAAWTALLPDKADAFGIADGALVAITHDGSRIALGNDGAVRQTTTLASDGLADAVTALAGTVPAGDDAQKKLAADSFRLVRFVRPNDAGLAVGYVGGCVRVLDAEGNAVAETQLDADVTGLAWLPDGTLAAAFSDGRVVGFRLP